MDQLLDAVGRRTDEQRQIYNGGLGALEGQLKSAQMSFEESRKRLCTDIAELRFQMGMLQDDNETYKAKDAAYKQKEIKYFNNITVA